MSYPPMNLCMHCMQGDTSGGVCTHCGKPASDMQPRDPLTLPMRYLLHQRYMIGGVLGRGGFGITYIAWDTKLNQRVAVKELFPVNIVHRLPDGHSIGISPSQESVFSSIRSGFRRETSTLIHMQDHSGIVRLFHAFEENNTAYYVMEYLDGQDLGHFLKKNGALSWEQLSPVVFTMLEALEQLHNAGLIHRDVTPDNIYLTNSGKFYLIDLGSARKYENATHFTAYVKYNFAPYEQYQSNGLQGPWTDVYSLCATIYYCLSGKLAPLAPQRQISDTLVPLKQLVPGLLENVYAAVEYGLRVRPQERIQSAPQLRNLLFPGSSDHRSTPAVSAPAPTQTGGIQGVSGYYQGKLLSLAPGHALRFGRLPELEVTYPAQAVGVSRRQCTLFLRQDGHYLIRDEGSSWGTFLIYGDQTLHLQNQQWYFADGCVVHFGQNEQFRIPYHSK